jgi:hypothetical protein
MPRAGIDGTACQAVLIALLTVLGVDDRHRRLRGGCGGAQTVTEAAADAFAGAVQVSTGEVDGLSAK